MKSSSKIFMSTLGLIIIIIALDLTNEIALSHKVIFIAVTGVTALAFQKIGGYYAGRPLKLPRWLQRLTLGRSAMEEIDRINDIIDPIDSALCRLESRLEFDLIKNGKIPAIEVNGIVAAIDELSTGGDTSDN